MARRHAAVALEAAHRTDSLEFSYKHLCLDPDHDMARLSGYLGVLFPVHVGNRVGRSSWSSERHIGALSAEEKISRWTRQTSGEQLSLIEDVLAGSGLDGPYGGYLLPAGGFAQR